MTPNSAVRHEPFGDYAESVSNSVSTTINLVEVRGREGGGDFKFS